MHSALRPFPLLLAFFAACLAGCRGTSPFGRYVQVTKEADQQLPDVEAPEQRLATAKPRTDLSGSQGQPMGQLASHTDSTQDARTVSARPATETTSGPAQLTLSDRPSTSADSDSNTAQTVSAPLESTQANAINPVDSEEMMEAFKNYPPEVQQEALRRLMAAARSNASRTNQPHAIDVSSGFADLPDLPEIRNAAPEVPPTRIGMQQPPMNPTVAVQVPEAAQGNDQKTADSQLVTTEVETPYNVSPAPAQATATPSAPPVASEPAVQTVSASESAGDRSMVRQAIDSSLSIDVDPTTLTDQLSDSVLYASLLQRLSTPIEGESEAERASRLIKLRHLMVLSGDPDSAVESVSGLSSAEQEYLRHQLLGLWTLVDPQGHPVTSRRFTAALPQIRDAAKFAGAATDSLEVRSLSFCTEIESYGQITTFSGNHFDPGQQVILYCEIENFTVTQKDSGFETHLQGSYDIFNDANEKVVSQLLPADQQTSANYLRDYFIAYQMHLPAQLAPGTYRMQLTMEDVAGKKYGQASIPFEITE
ncbi:MAG: hypothetical protein AAGI63_04960 [Planctomycetota bacterium]